MPGRIITGQRAPAVPATARSFDRTTLVGPARGRWPGEFRKVRCAGSRDAPAGRRKARSAASTVQPAGRQRVGSQQAECPAQPARSGVGQPATFTASRAALAAAETGAQPTARGLRQIKLQAARRQYRGRQVSASARQTAQPPPPPRWRATASQPPRAAIGSCRPASGNFGRQGGETARLPRTGMSSVCAPAVHGVQHLANS